MNEKKLEKKLKNELKKLGGKAVKFSSPYETGWPDRIVLFNGCTFWVELKTTGKKLEPRQTVVRKELAKLGFEVKVLDTEEKLNDFLKLLK